MIKIVNSIFENSQYLKTFQKISTLDLLISDAFRINRLVKKLDELSVEYAGLKKVLTDKYGTTDDDKVTIKKENVQAFSEEYGELLKIEHDLKEQVERS